MTQGPTAEGAARQGSPGEQLFARYVYAPNHLGYCGPAEAAALFELGVTGRTDADIVSIAQRFSGAWPYAQLIAEIAGVEDPLDADVMRTYWLGAPLLDAAGRETFGRRLLELFGAQAGHYWTYLTPELHPEVAPTHGFHVLAVYPWSRLLAAGAPEPVQVLDSCRIRWGEVVRVEGDHVVVSSRRLTWDGEQLGLGPVSQEWVRHLVDGRGFVPDPEPGEWLALHWDWVSDRLSEAAVDDLERETRWQLEATNDRLARERGAASTG